MRGCVDLSVSAYKSLKRYKDPAESKAASVLTALPGSITRKTGGIEQYPANPTCHLKMLHQPR